MSCQVLITLAWVSAMFPAWVAAYHGWSVAAAGTESAALSGAELAVLRICQAGTVALAGWLILTAPRTQERSAVWRLLVFLAPCAYVVVLDLSHANAPGLGALVVPVVVVALWWRGAGLDSLRAVGTLTVVTAVSCLAFAVVDPARAVMSAGAGARVNADKALLGDGLLQGWMGHPNTLGMALALGAAWVSLVRTGWVRFAGLAAVGLALVWSSSRTSLVAVCAAVAVVAVCRAWRRRAPLIAGLAMAVVAAAAVLVPFVVTNPLALTGRGAIWMVTREYLGEHPLTGNGSYFFSTLLRNFTDYGTGANTYVYHAHNLPLQLLVVGGVLLMVLAAGVAVMAFARVLFLVRSYLRLTPLFFAIVAGVLSIAEAPAELLTRTELGVWFWIPVAIICLAPLPSVASIPDAGAPVSRGSARSANGGHRPRRGTGGTDLRRAPAIQR